MGSALAMRYITYVWETADSLENMKEKALHLLHSMHIESEYDAREIEKNKTVKLVLKLVFEVGDVHTFIHSFEFHAVFVACVLVLFMNLGHRCFDESLILL